MSFGDDRIGDSAQSYRQKYLDDVAVCRLVLRTAWDCKDLWTQDSDLLLRRVELDWDRLSYLTECGLARPLFGRTKGVEPPDWAPGFFLKGLEQRAGQDALNDLIKREALRRIAEALREIGASGVLLKGSALLVLRDNVSNMPAQRSTGDVDLYVEPPLGVTLRRSLIAAHGFAHYIDDHDVRTAQHHLAPVLFRGVAVEIHERIMPSFWGLPEREMLAQKRAVDGLAPLYTLSPEGLLLHAGIHASSHLFSNGLKTAWDLHWLSRRFPELDWDRIADWTEASRLPRAFWAPVRSLAQELSLPLPAEFLRRAPDDRRQAKLETIARHRLFSAIEGPYDLNPLTKTAVFLALHDSLPGRMQYLLGLMSPRASASRGSAERHHPSQSPKYIRRLLREARIEWRSYQRSLG
jgi:hypothetical protein